MTTKELREIDVFCAENVMGWRRCAVPLGNLLPNQFCVTEDEGLLVATTGDEPNSIYFEQWHPTEEASAAMEVLKKCHERREIIFTQKRHNCWVVGVYSTERNAPLVEIYGEAETLELAICLFSQKLFSK